MTEGGRCQRRETLGDEANDLVEVGLSSEAIVKAVLVNEAGEGIEKVEVGELSANTFHVKLKNGF